MSNETTGLTLTRKQIERIITFMALDEGVESVTISEEFRSGIGASHWAVFNKSQVERSFQADITDVSNW